MTDWNKLKKKLGKNRNYQVAEEDSSSPPHLHQIFRELREYTAYIKQEHDALLLKEQSKNKVYLKFFKKDN